MKKDIILAGVGGQGIISIAATIGFASLESGLNMKQSEVHGMSQRGGAVQSHFRLSDGEIASDLIPDGAADIIISVEPMEALRYLNMLSPGGWVITNTTPYINIPNYPEMESVFAELNKLDRQISLDADKIARDIGSPKSANIVVLGAASPYLDIEYTKLEKALGIMFGRKGEKVLNANIEALRLGREFAENN